MSLKTSKLLILASVILINKEKSYKLLAGLLAMLLLNLLKAKSTMGKSQISGAQVLFYLLKFVVIFPSKIKIHKACTRKS